MNALFKEKSPDAIVTIPNIVTVAGILLIIPYVWGFLTEHRWVMFISLFLSGLSDGLDGFLARELKQKTRIGEMIDPARDRFLLLAIFIHFLYLLFIAISPNDMILAINTLFFVSEFSIMLFDQYWWRHKINEVREHKIRKIRQASLIFLAGAVFLDYYFRDIITAIVGNYNWLTVAETFFVMTIISCVTLGVYIVKYFEK